MTIVIVPDPAYVAYVVLWWACISASMLGGHRLGRAIGWRLVG